MSSLRHTKIVVTLGPATDDESILESVLLAGACVFRMNFSHGELSLHHARIRTIRALAQKHHKEVAILVDLQGPKIRIGKFKNRQVELVCGQTFILDSALGESEGDEQQVALAYPQLIKDLKDQDILLLDDGRMVMRVQRVEATRVYCEVLVSGPLSNNKGINRQGGGLSARALTDKDRLDIQEAVRAQADYIAVSFPRNAEDIEEARALIQAAGGRAGIISKIERTEAIHNLNAIIQVSDAVMIARGDLGVEMGDAELPALQKKILRVAHELNKPVITATQMLESMIHNSIPTRAEVSDVANAVLDGTDAVMLSGETAVGEFPDKAVAAMDRICLSAEKYQFPNLSDQRTREKYCHHVDEAIALATMFTANHLNIQAIVALTESGTTPLLMSRNNSAIPIFGLSRHPETLRRMTLFRGVYPILFDATPIDRRTVNQAAIQTLVDQSILKSGDLVLITKGDLMGVHGRTNSLKIMVVP